MSRVDFRMSTLLIDHVLYAAYLSVCRDAIRAGVTVPAGYGWSDRVAVGDSRVGVGNGEAVGGSGGMVEASGVLDASEADFGIFSCEDDRVRRCVDGIVGIAFGGGVTSRCVGSSQLDREGACFSVACDGDRVKGTCEKSGESCGDDETGKVLESSVLGAGCQLDAESVCCAGKVVDEVESAGEQASVVSSVPEVVESKYERNRRWAAERKSRKLRRQEKKKKGFFPESSVGVSAVPEWRRGASVGVSSLKIGQVVAGCVVAEDVDGDLKDSVKRKWKAKNELEIAKAQRELEVLKGNSVEDEVRNRQVSTRAAIERSMVSIEKTHAQLRRADCVVRSDDDVSGTVETLVSGVSSGTISPNSSVSEAEVRKLQKDFADGQAEIERLRSALSRVGLDLAMVDAMDKKEWTVDLTGHVSEEVEDVFDRLYPRGTAYPDDPHMCDDGKLRRTIIGF